MTLPTQPSQFEIWLQRSFYWFFGYGTVFVVMTFSTTVQKAFAGAFTYAYLIDICITMATLGYSAPIWVRFIKKIRLEKGPISMELDLSNPTEKDDA